MRNIVIPETVEAYQADIMARAFPDQQIVDNDFYRRLIGWIMDVRTPLLYEQDHPDERANLSINFNWLILRDYADTHMGAPDTAASLYALHEFTHMTHWLPTPAENITAAEYAEQFTGSEYRASNESEILVYYRIPELRQVTFPGLKLAVDIMKQRGIAQPTSALLGKVRSLLVEHNDFDHLVGDDPDIKAELARVKHYGGNREWSAQHYETIKDRFIGADLPQGGGLTDGEYEEFIATYEPQLTQGQYEQNVIRNVRFAYAMCGLEVPLITSFKEARELATQLEGTYVLVSDQS